MKVLVVEDSAAVRNQIRRELESDGYEVHEAKDGLEAFKRLLTLRPDLITLDVEMPNMDGFETCQKLRGERYSQVFRSGGGGRIPVLFVTGTDTLEGRARGFEVGATDFVAKPFQKGEIVEAVNRILRPPNVLAGLTAVVADDSTTTLYILSEILNGFGVKVFEASNGVEAFDVISRHLGSIDMVITDLVMPEMGGKELCAKIRYELNARDVPVIILTAMAEHPTLLELFEAGATDYLVKPFVREELLARLRIHLEARVLNRELRQKVDALKKLDRLKSQFMAACSHDLRSPLNGILGMADVLLESDDLPEREKNLISLIRKSGDYLSKLVADILELHLLISQDSELEQVPVSLGEIAESCVETMRYMAMPKSVEVVLKTNPQARTGILGDQMALKRVLNNLLSNAIKFTPRNGKVTVTVDRLDDATCFVSVADTGTGMSRRKLAEFSGRKKVASSRGTEGEAGTGLGLAIVFELVEKLGGSLQVSSELNKGTEFTLAFPSARFV